MLDETQAVLKDFVLILSSLSIHYALVGGIAAGYWSEERFTRDIDFTVALSEQDWSRVRTKLENLPDVQIDKMNYDEGSRLPYLVRLTFRGQPIDLLVSMTEFQDSLLSRRLEIDLADTKVFIASPEDIIVSKLVAWRTLDRADIEKIILKLSDLDFSYIRKWAEVWEVKDRWEEVEKEQGPGGGAE